MTTSVRFDDHPGFHREVLAGAAAAAAGGGAWSLASSSPWAWLQGAAVGLVVGLALVHPGGRARRLGLGLVAVSAGLLAVHLGAGLWGLAGLVALLAALTGSWARAPLAALVGLGVGYAGAWAATRVGVASELGGWPDALHAGAAAATFGLTAAVARAVGHVNLVRDPVAAAYRALPSLDAEARALVERGRAIWQATQASPVTAPEHRALVEDGVLQVLRAAERLARTPAVDTADITRRQTELDQRIDAATDAVARDQYRQARATLDDQKRYAERVGAARERIVARMHHGVTTLETFRLACAQLDATAAAREAADARSAMAVLAEVGDDAEPAALPPAAPAA